MPINYKTLGKRISIARNSIGMTQEVLAERINCSTSYISYIETGAKHLSIKADSDAKLEQAKREIETERDIERTRHAKAEFEYATQNKELLGKIDEAFQEGAKKNAEKLADKADFSRLVLRDIFFGHTRHIRNTD